MRNDGPPIATICRQRGGHLTDQLHIQHCVTNPFIGEHGRKYKGTKRFNGKSYNANANFARQIGEYSTPCKRPHQVHSIEDKSAPWQK